MTRGRHRADDIPEGRWLPGGNGIPRRYERACATCGELFWATRLQRSCSKACQAKPVAIRIAERVDRRGPDECWPWTGAECEGYGIIWIRGTRVRVTRLILESALGRPLGPGTFALHHCDSPPCCNRLHLYEGTKAENIADAWRRGRRSRAAQSARSSARRRDEWGRFLPVAA